MASMRILSFDIGGTHLKAAIVNERGHFLADRVKVGTPDPCPPKVMVKTLAGLVKELPRHDCIAIGFPGVICDGRVITAPHWGNRIWHNFPLAQRLSAILGGEALLINDAEMQGLAAIKRRGIELMLTLGTGAGTGLFRDGELMPHLELSHHPIHGDKTYDEWLGDAALKTAGKKQWNKRVAKTIDILLSLLNFDHLYIGGGNSAHVKIKLPKHVTLTSNDLGIEGAGPLWHYASRVKR